MVTVLDSLQWLEKSRKINDKDVVLCWHFHFLPFSQKVAPCVLKGNHSFFIVAVTKVSINHGQDGSVIVKTAILLGPGCTKQNFIFFAKKSVNRKPFLVWMFFFFHQTSFLKCHQSSKMLSKRFGGVQFLVRYQTPLFLNSYSLLGHLPLNDVSG